MSRMYALAARARKGFYSLLAAILILTPSTSFSNEMAAMPERLRLGVIVGTEGNVKERVEPFRYALEEIADLPVDLFLLETMAEAIEALATDKVDYVRLSPSAYGATHTLCECVEPLVTAGPDNFPARFHAILVAKKGETAKTLNDLKGTRLAVGALHSVTGYRVPLASFAADGINAREHFSALVEVKNPVDGLRAVLDGRVQSALAWSTLAGKAENGYTAGTLNDYFVSGGRGIEELEIIWKSAPIPYSAHSLRADLPDELKRRIRAGLMELRNESPDAYLAIEPDLPGGFEPVGHGDYRPILRTFDDAYKKVLSPVADLRN